MNHPLRTAKVVSFFPLCVVIVLAFVFRLYRIEYPLADWHSWRQVDTASVTREYVKRGVDLLHPTYHDLSNIPNLMDNTAHGYRMVEFPFVNGLIATVIRLFPQLPVVPTSRFFSILVSLGTLIFLYLCTRIWFGKSVALVTALTFAVLPYSIYYSRVILPEPYMLFFSTTAVYFFSLWSLTGKWRWVISSGVSLSLAMLLKPFAAFLFPLFGYILVRTFALNLIDRKSRKFKIKIGKSILLLIQVAVMGLIAAGPFLWWRHWIAQYPEGIPASTWLFNSNGIRWRPAWVRWLGYERLTKMFLGFVGIVFLPFSLIPSIDFKARRIILNTQYLILASWWFSIFLYFSLIATGNVQHDYYQNLMLPIVCLSVGVGVMKLYTMLRSIFQNLNSKIQDPRFKIRDSRTKSQERRTETQDTRSEIQDSRHKIRDSKFNFFGNISFEIKCWKLNIAVFPFLLVVGVYVAMLYGSWQQVKGFFNVNHWEYVEAGAAVNRLTPPDAKVIAPAFGDTQFLFQTNRTGWPIGGEIEDKITKGATHYVTTTYDDEARALEEKYRVIEKNEKFLIIELQ